VWPSVTGHGRRSTASGRELVFEDGSPLLDVNGLDAVAEHAARLAELGPSAFERRCPPARGDGDRHRFAAELEEPVVRP